MAPAMATSRKATGSSLLELGEQGRTVESSPNHQSSVGVPRAGGVAQVVEHLPSRGSSLECCL
jgi:hypothetical protein